MHFIIQECSGLINHALYVYQYVFQVKPYRSTYMARFQMNGTFSVKRHLVPLFLIENKPPNISENTIHVKILNDKNQMGTNAIIGILI